MSFYIFLGVVLFMNAIILPTAEGKFALENNIEKRDLDCKWIGESAGTDEWCNWNCNHVPPYCPPDFCECS